MAVRIIVDSTADMKKEVEERVEVIPLTLQFGDEEFIDGITINSREFYEKLIESDVLPHTSQATPADYENKFNEIKQSGDSAVMISLASKLSGTYQSATIAAEDYDNIYVVDSDTVTIGTGVLVDYALKLVDNGLDAQSIAKELEIQKKKINIIALVDTLEYLKKGGRISKTVAFAGTLLNIKPVISLTEGEINILGKARGSKQANNLLVTEIEKAGGVDYSKPILLGYTGLSDTLLLKYIEDSAKLWENMSERPEYTIVGSVIGTHVGPGAIAAAFFSI